LRQALHHSDSTWTSPDGAGREAVQTPRAAGFPTRTIFDRAGRELAVSLRVSSVFAQPPAIANPRETARALAPILGQSARELQARLNTDKPFVWLQRQLEPRQAEAIGDLGLKGIGLVPESRRYYPRQDLASHVLGAVGLDDRGLEGVEHLYDDLLGGSRNS